MLIPVIYIDNNVGMVDPERLDRLIESRQIMAFRRSEGMVRIGHDPVRSRSGSYDGLERRQQPNER
ncbi:MAG TPA: hypothetical protein VIU41_00070 [Geobacteraceae bacterium]